MATCDLVHEGLDVLLLEQADELGGKARTDELIPVTRSDLPKSITHHDLRHCHAGLPIRHGESIKTVQERLGHVSAVTTLKHLQPPLAGLDDRTRAAVNEVLREGLSALRVH